MFDTFDKKVIYLTESGDFRKDIFENEVVWTYAIGKLACNNPRIYEKLTGLKYIESHNIYLEAQPKTVYSGLEGNSVIDLAAGAIKIRDNTTSGIELLPHKENKVCFLEAKYNSDLSIRTSHCVIRNQMDRVLENLLIFHGENEEPSEVVFSLLTPRIYKDYNGTRIYSYKFKEYKKLLNNQNDMLAKKIMLSSHFEPAQEKSHSFDIEKMLSRLSLKWISFEEIIEMEFSDVKNLDITNYSEAEKIWLRLRKKVLNDE